MPRVEDFRFLTGRGRYLADLAFPGEVCAAFVRSPHAHARIARVDATAARNAPGVLCVLTGDDAGADGLGGIPAEAVPAVKPPAVLPTYPVLAGRRVRFVGQPIAVVVGENVAEARDAAELVEVHYEPLRAVTSVAEASAPGAPLVWKEAAGNICYRHRAGDPDAVARAMAAATHVTRLRLVNNRLIGNPLEPRAAVGLYDAGAFILHVGAQMPHLLRRQLAENVLHVPATAVRVVVPDMGGAFGMKGPLYPEYAAVLWAARRIGRPVKWIAERTEAQASDTHARDHVTDAALALDGEGRMLALEVCTYANLGAYVSTHGAIVPLGGVQLLTGVYAIPLVSTATVGLFTNTVPTDAYRGAGRPEAIYVIERLVDAAARELGIDPAVLRRRNCVAPASLPYRNALGFTYDSGDFPHAIDEATRSADWSNFATRRRAAKARGRRRGIGIACGIDRAGGGGLDETAEIRFDATGAVTVMSGTVASGQGHETVFAALAARLLGVPIEEVSLVQGDTGRIAAGTGTFGSRSLVAGGTAIAVAADMIIAKAKSIAAHALEVADADVVFENGRFVVAGTDRAMTMREVARRAYTTATLPPGVVPGLAESACYRSHAHSFPNGAHVCEVEVDPETGAVAVVAYVAVGDFGVVMNEEIVEGQVHGGIAQGLGQALMEHAVYDRGSGQLLSATFLDYAMPRAADVPPFAFTRTETPCLTNRLGVKGCGESGVIVAPPAIINAIVDALAPLGVRHLDMPATPEVVWRAIRDAGAKVR